MMVLLFERTKLRYSMINFGCILNIIVAANSVLSNNNFAVRKLSEVSVENIFHVPKKIAALLVAFIVAISTAPVERVFVA